MTEYTVIMTWDREAAVWCAVNDDIPIALESNSFDVLVERVKVAVPELLQLNGADTRCRLNFEAERREDIA
ncbi:MAG: DUF1902 domain-containing protein [Oscillospiraceae bacterium]|nr:DUF1902 domain-containing protein [Oscillospiraceae bacterium]